LEYLVWIASSVGAAMNETQYWLEVIVEAEMLSWEQVKTDYKECSELLAIFISISTTL